MRKFYNLYGQKNYKAKYMHVSKYFHDKEIVCNKIKLHIYAKMTHFLNPIPTEGGPFGPEQPKTVWHFHSFMAGVTKIHDFVYFSICLVPVKLFLKKNYEILKN